MCDDRKNNNNSSLFIMGLILGAIIAGVVVLTSAEDKAKVIKKIKDKFNDLFGTKEKIVKKKRTSVPPLRDTSIVVPLLSKKTIKKTNNIIAKNIVKPIQKISVDIPKGVESLNLTPVKVAKSKKVFKKS